MKCIQKAWKNHQHELRIFFRGQLGDAHWAADDLLQDVFVKAIAYRETFCRLKNPRAWLYRVAKNRLIDFQRSHKYYAEVSDYPAETYEPSPLENLSKCLPPVLEHLSADDQEIIEWCDLEGLHQADYARLKDLSVVAVKSRIQRARKRLKIRLQSCCQVVFDGQGTVCCFSSNAQFN
jgi:RNA polymerase sigma-70 factor (ECF subfamily)